jgi:D-tyrosyl-tRNA(Tyr) deacylase
MKIVIQRVSSASVKVDGAVVSSINRGMLILVCMEKGDEIDHVKVAQKLVNLRIFQDESTGKMNQNILQVQGEILCVSQFTLSWDGKRGNRPSFDNSMEPDLAEKEFNLLCDSLEKQLPIKRGVFGASMEVALVNDGPVTFSLAF